MSPEPVSVWIMGDQLLEDHPALAAADEGTRILLIESRQRAARLPYQRKKLVLISGIG